MLPRSFDFGTGHGPLPRRVMAALLVLASLAASLPSQEPQPAPAPAGPAGRLEQLIKELRAIEPLAWEARVAALKSRIAQHRGEAAKLREEAKRLEAAALEEDRRSRELEQEIERQAALQKLLGLPKAAEMKTPGAKAPEAKAAEMKAAAETKVAGESPGSGAAPATPMAPGKPADAKPSPKKAAEPPKPQASEAKQPPPASPAASEKAAPGAAKAGVVFADEVLPIFEQHCTGCHNPDDPSGNLDLTTYAGARRGGSSGEVVKPGDPQGSRLFRLVSHLETPTMPPDQGRIPEGQIERLKAWILEGALEKPEAKAAPPASAGTADPPAAEKEDPTPDAGAADVPMPVALAPIEGAFAAGVAPVKAIATSPVAPLVAVASGKRVLLLHAGSLLGLGALEFEPGFVEVLEFSDDGERLLVAGGQPGRSGAAQIFDVRTGAVVRSFRAGGDTVLAAALSPRQTLVALGGPDRRVRIFATETGEVVAEVGDHDDWVLALDVSPDGNYLASGDRSGKLLITEADTGIELHRLEGHRGAIQAVRFRSDAAQLASASEDGTVRTWDAVSGRSLRTQQAHAGGALGLAWRGDHLLASAGADHRVKTWKPAGGLQKATADLGDWVYAVAFGSEGRRLFAGTWAGRLQVFEGDVLTEVKLGAP